MTNPDFKLYLELQRAVIGHVLPRAVVWHRMPDGSPNWFSLPSDTDAEFIRGILHKCGIACVAGNSHEIHDAYVAEHICPEHKSCK